MDTSRSRDIVVFGGGTATNSLVDVFENLRKSHNCPLKYVIPISDNGGSSSELIRVFGGPGIGDVRSRLVRLIPNSETDLERASIKALFNYRLSSNPVEARTEWLDIVEGRHKLWTEISSEKRELIRSIFNHMNMEIVRRARPSSVFNFAKASIGNLFLTGARLFTGSFESAIYLLSTICTIPSTVTTLPSINSNFTHHICAELADGSRITGQNAISHPSEPTSLPDTGAAGDTSPQTGTAFSSSLSPNSVTGAAAAAAAARHRHESHNNEAETEAHDRIEDATLPGSLPSLRKPYIEFTKRSLLIASSATTPASTSASTPAPPSPSVLSPNPASTTLSPAPQTQSYDNDHAASDDLPARITRIYYINPYGHEIFPLANPKLTSSLASARAIIYSIGSLYTSLIPNLILRGVGRAISSTCTPRRNNTNKILILNSSIDRETGPTNEPLTATDFVRAIVRACEESQGIRRRIRRGRRRRRSMSVSIGDEDKDKDKDKDESNAAGGSAGDAGGEDDDEEKEEEEEKIEITKYVTHLLYLEGEGVPKVDKAELAALGVECIRVYGRRVDGMLCYDEAGLAGALEAVVGKTELVRNRRNTSGQ